MSDEDPANHRCLFVAVPRDPDEPALYYSARDGWVEESNDATTFARWRANPRLRAHPSPDGCRDHVEVVSREAVNAIRATQDAIHEEVYG